jgi:hypothetical protein
MQAQRNEAVDLAEPYLTLGQWEILHLASGARDMRHYLNATDEAKARDLESKGFGVFEAPNGFPCASFLINSTGLGVLR